MKTVTFIRRFLNLCLVVGLWSSNLPSVRAAQNAQTPPSVLTTIRIAPPAPVFNDDERRAELVARRARVAQEIGDTGVLVMFSAEPRIYTNDVDYEYRQENNLYYLTHLKQQNATLVLMPGSATREILFLPRRNPARETWDGYMYSPEEARQLSGVAEIWDAREFQPFAEALRARTLYRPKPENVLLTATSGASDASKPAPEFASALMKGARRNTGAPQNDLSLYLLVPLREADSNQYGDSREWKQEQRFATGWTKTPGAFKVRSAFPIFSAMRLRKSESEVRRLQHAVDITSEALGRAMAVAGRAQWEYEVEAEVEYTFKRRNADFWGYPSIVGCGPNATTLHYNESQGRIKPGELLLMDVGAEYDHYTADITRTFPVSGKFSSAQADIYNVVLAAQEAGMRAARPGSTKSEVHDAATEVVKDGLLKLGLITDRNSMQYRLWFMHGTSHWLGMNVHDVGDGNPKLEPGMIFTNEPGIYIRGDALDYLPKSPENDKFIAAIRPAYETYKNIGVRIEDDVLITTGGHKNLSQAIPRTIPDIEAFIARASNDLRGSAPELHRKSFNDSHAFATFIDLTFAPQLLQHEHSNGLQHLAPFGANPGGRTARRRGISFVGSPTVYARSPHVGHHHAD